ncbi:hypothetical protein DFR31_0555 [Alkalispirillum mobile]|uniref:HEPN AbiJ-N-terminal domain-containing protein n=1 Tax=Alkalispirillum mobile TaxID=85925 RepID=A0A498C6G4_9GAMM|nr:hypothetical protein [Alkalispirillum mobile]RLK50649.1 hypothetical protein DFR31_0555 [Alkalispirillum mobile]
MKFSQRMGLAPVNSVIQTEGMSEELQNSLWNVLDIHIWSSRGFLNPVSHIRNAEIYTFSRKLWFGYFKKPLDSIPEYEFQIMDEIRGHFFSRIWHEVFDFIEFVLSIDGRPALSRDINSVLEAELSGYRVIDGLVTPISEEVERESLEEALGPGPFDGVETHLKQALMHLSNRDHPDFRNSIKESISAVESLACTLTSNSKATLGDALKVLERENQLHGALKQGFSALYGYTSDADGIRHRILEGSTIDANDAKYFLVSCAAFINYLKAKHAKAT